MPPRSIGGSFAKAGLVEVLYLAECAGLVIIWLGDRVCSRQGATAPVQPSLATP